MIETLKSAAKKAAGWIPDALFITGGACLAFGAGLVYPPAGWIVAGLLLMGAGYLAARGVN